MGPAADNPHLELPDLLPRPQTPEEEQALVSRFLAGMRKRFAADRDPEQRERLLRAIRHPVDCKQCAAACHVFQATGCDESYRPGLRGGILRRAYHKYVKGGGRFSTWWHGNVDLDWPRMARLAQLAYACNLCGRCAQSCRGADHALVSSELRSIFREIGIAPADKKRIDPDWVRERIRAIDELTSQRAGIESHTPWDVPGAEVLLVQPASNVRDWPENVGATALLLNSAGIRWTMASELAGDGLGRCSADDSVERLKAARRTLGAARSLQVKRVVAGEFGPAYRELRAYAPAAAGDEPDPLRESVVTLVRDIVHSGRLQFDPVRNDFPVTLHDPCELARQGVVEPQREVLRQLCPQFREMDPWGEHNYCCGGGGGMTQIEDMKGWRVQVSGKKKMEQVLDAFSECLEPDTRKYLCAPCGDCKTQLNELLAEHAPWERNRIRCGGLAELVVNAMVRVRPGFLNWESVQ